MNENFKKILLLQLNSSLKKIYKNGTVELETSVYDDLPPVPLLTARVAANAPTLAVFAGNVYQYTFDATNDEVFGATEITHKYKEGTDINIHVHWATNGSEGTAKYVKWELEYTIADGNAAFGTPVVVSAEVEIAASLADRTHKISTIGTIPGTGLTIGAYICWRFRRIAATGAAPLADPFGLAVGFHTQIDTIGSRQLNTK